MYNIFKSMITNIFENELLALVNMSVVT